MPDNLARTISAAQCRAARALIQWRLADLAAASGVSVSAINDFELGGRQCAAINLAAIRSALEAAGIVFENRPTGFGPGVSLRFGRNRN